VGLREDRERDVWPVSGHDPDGRLLEGLDGVLAAGGCACLIARAGSIVGPHDNLGQLPWWLTRIAAAGRVIAPGDPGRGLQLIDARDVSAFVLDQVEARAGGIHNVVPDGPNTTMGQLIDSCVRATGSDASPVWMDENFLLSQGVQPWSELPLWTPDVQDTAGFWAVSGASAKAAGLHPRPFGDSVRDTWEWLRSAGQVQAAPGIPPFGLASGKEQQVLAAWDSQPPRDSLESASSLGRRTRPGPAGPGGRRGLPGRRRRGGWCRPR